MIKQNGGKGFRWEDYKAYGSFLAPCRLTTNPPRHPRLHCALSHFFSCCCQHHPTAQSLEWIKIIQMFTSKHIMLILFDKFRKTCSIVEKLNKGREKKSNFASVLCCTCCRQKHSDVPVIPSNHFGNEEKSSHVVQKEILGHMATVDIRLSCSKKKYIIDVLYLHTIDMQR